MCSDWEATEEREEMKLIQNRLRFCEAFKAMLEQPHKIGIRLPMWRGAYVGLLRLERKLDKNGKTWEKLYYTSDPADLNPRLGADELLSEEWETYEV
jgi:hypothetical protein